MQVNRMHPVNLLLYLFVFALAGQYVMIQCGVCESDLVLIGHSAESVRWCFLGQSLWDSKYFTNLDNFVYEQISKRAEVPGGITVFGRISGYNLRNGYRYLPHVHHLVVPERLHTMCSF